MKGANNNFSVSVVIPAFNEQDKIKSCLESLSRQKYKKTETILVDDCSRDNTVLIAKKIGNFLKLTLKIIQLNKHQERGVARNIGAKSAVGNYLLFIDADMQLGKNVITECIELVQGNSNIKAAIIPEESKGEGFWAECRRLEKKCYLGDDRIEAARFFERKAFWKIGGWDEKMISGEDWDLTRRIKSFYRIGRINSFIVHNEYNLTLYKAIKKKFYYAYVSGIYLRKNRLNLSAIIFFVFRPSFIRNWKLILSDPLYGIGMLFLKTMELSAGGAGYLVSKLLNRL